MDFDSLSDGGKIYFVVHITGRLQPELRPHRIMLDAGLTKEQVRAAEREVFDFLAGCASLQHQCLTSLRAQQRRAHKRGRGEN